MLDYASIHRTASTVSRSSLEERGEIISLGPLSPSRYIDYSKEVRSNGEESRDTNCCIAGFLSFSPPRSIVRNSYNFNCAC